MRRSILTALAAAALAAAAAAPAQAGVSITTTGNSQTLPGTSSTMVSRSVECTAVALPQGAGATVAWFVGITDCYLRGVNSGAIYRVGDNDSSPAADATGGVVRDVPTEPFEICVRAVAFGSDANFYESPLRCSAN